MAPSMLVVPNTSDSRPPAPTSAATPATRRYAEVSPTLFRLLWICVVGLHGFCGIYYLGMARFYWTTSGTYLSGMLDHNKIGIESVHYPSVAIVYGCVGAAHGIFIVMMIFQTIRNRRCSFGSPDSPSADLCSPHRQDSGHLGCWLAPTHLLIRVRTCLNGLFGRKGFFGVEGKYFETQLLLLELLETALQSNQAYNMSEHVPRPWLNRLLVVLLVVSCLLTPAVHMLFEHQSLTRRAVSLGCDALLDFVSAVVIPVCLIILYLPCYDPAGDGISLSYWTDDTWLVNAQNEFRLLLVTSWWDLCSRVVVSIGFIASLESSISLVRVKSDRRPGHRKSAVVDFSHFVTREPSGSSSNAFEWLRDSVRGRRLDRMAHGALAVWGIIILALHIHASSLPNSPVCIMQLRPWLNSKPACALVRIDCYDDAVQNYSSAELVERYSVLDDLRITRLLVRHCPSLRVPPSIRNYKRLTVMKIYNSTIVQWPTEAALTSKDHPIFRIVALVRVAFPDGQLPDGLTHPDFPKTVNGIQVCVSNLRTLPPDLDTKWPSQVYLLLEESQFESFPTALFGLRPFQISFARNQFTTFPFEALALDGLAILNMGGNQRISSLVPPAGTIIAPSLALLNIIDTNVSVLPSWFDGRLQGLINRAMNGEPVTYPLLAASGTPLCVYTTMIINGSMHSYPELDHIPANQLSFVMNFTHNDAKTLASLALCEILKDPLYYPLGSEDLRYRLV